MTDAIGIAGSALSVHRQWLDAIADNIANANNVSSTEGAAFQARYLVAEAGEGTTGVSVTRVESGDAEGRIVNQPDHPLADADGNVRYPDIDLAEQMGALIMAQRDQPRRHWPGSRAGP